MHARASSFGVKAMYTARYLKVSGVSPNWDRPRQGELGTRLKSVMSVSSSLRTLFSSHSFTDHSESTLGQGSHTLPDAPL